MEPDSVDVANLDEDRSVHLDSMLNAAALRAAQDGLRVNRVAVGLFSAERGGMSGGVMHNVAIPGVVNAGAVITDDGIAVSHAVHPGASGAATVARAPNAMETVAIAAIPGDVDNRHHSWRYHACDFR